MTVTFGYSFRNESVQGPTCVGETLSTASTSIDALTGQRLKG